MFRSLRSTIAAIVLTLLICVIVAGILRQQGWFGRSEKTFNDNPAPPPGALGPRPTNPVELMSEYTRVHPKADVSLRLPAGLNWNEKEHNYQNLDLGMTVTCFLGTGKSLDQAIQFWGGVWKEPGHTLLKTKDVTCGDLKGKLQEGKWEGKNGSKYALLWLLIGNEENSAAIRVQCRDEESLVSLGRRSLETTKWDGTLSHPVAKFPDPPADKLKLNDEYSHILLTGISIRLPVASEWDEQAGALKFPALGAWFKARNTPGVSLEKATKMTEGFFASYGVKLLSEQNVDVGKAKGKLLEGTKTTAQSGSRS